VCTLDKCKFCAPSRPETRTGFGVSYSRIEGLVEAASGDLPAKLVDIMKKGLSDTGDGQF